MSRRAGAAIQTKCSGGTVRGIEARVRVEDACQIERASAASQGCETTDRSGLDVQACEDRFTH
jgi:hypothetical protein